MLKQRALLFPMWAYVLCFLCWFFSLSSTPKDEKWKSLYLFSFSFYSVSHWPFMNSKLIPITMGLPLFLSHNSSCSWFLTPGWHTKMLYLMYTEKNSLFSSPEGNVFQFEMWKLLLGWIYKPSKTNKHWKNLLLK